MARPAPVIHVTEAQRPILEGLARSRETAHSLVQRAQIVRRAAAGEPSKQIAQVLGLNEDAVGQWRGRWAEAQEGLAALCDQRQRAAIMEVLSDRPRAGCPGEFTPEQICRIIALAGETPPAPLTHWTRADRVRETIARGIAPTISASTIGRFLKSGRPQAASHPLLAQSQDQRRSHLSSGGAHGLSALSPGRGVA